MALLSMTNLAYINRFLWFKEMRMRCWEACNVISKGLKKVYIVSYVIGPHLGWLEHEHIIIWVSFGVHLVVCVRDRLLILPF